MTLEPLSHRKRSGNIFDDEEDLERTTSAASTLSNSSELKKQRIQSTYYLRATSDEISEIDLKLDSNDVLKLKSLPCNQGVIVANRCSKIFVKIGNNDPVDISPIVDIMLHGLGHLMSTNITISNPLEKVNSFFFFFFIYFA